MTATDTPNTFAAATTAHGNLTYFTTASTAAAQAVLDTHFFITELAGQAPTFDAAASGFSKVVEVVTALTDAAASGSSAAAAIAALIKDEDGNGVMDAMEIEIVNNTSQPLIVIACTTTGCRAADAVQTLLPCSTDVFLMTASDKRFDTNTKFGIGFLIGGSSASSSIEVGVNFSYTDTGNPGRWAVAMDIDRTTPAESFAPNLQLVGGRFLGNPGYPSFSVYVAPVETTSGKMTLTFVDTPTS